MVIFSDGLNENIIDTIELLKTLGIKVCLISGDTQQARNHIAKTIGIDECYAEISPNQKVEIVAKLKKIIMWLLLLVMVLMVFLC